MNLHKDAGGAKGTGAPETAGWFCSLLKPETWKRTLFYIVTDAGVVIGASVLSHVAVIRHVDSGLKYYTHGVLPFAAVALFCQLTLGFLFSSYKLKWLTFSIVDVPRVMSPSLATALLLGLLSGARAFAGLTPWTAVTWGLLSACGVIAVRGSRRFYGEVVLPKSGKRALLVMCSHRGYFMLETLRRIPHFNYRLLGFIDPELHNRNTVSQGLPVLGTFEDVEQVVARHRVETAFVFLSSDPTFAIGEFCQRLYELGLEVRLIPSMADLIDDRADIGAMERLTIHELTGQQPVKVDPGEMEQVFGNKCIMVTGAGGSIGSELCRQLARFDPSKLVLFERDDSNLFYVERDLRASHPQLRVIPFLGDITREADVARAFGQTRPDIVFHAAAYKHVPILEFHPAEAVRVNVHGSHLVARAAVEHGTESFVYISTDKAVNPSSVMGASKRIGETLATAMNNSGGVRFLAVRFGNVLDSRGSVTTIFRDAIVRREPVTVTDPEMKRYVMLTSEAVLLVMQAVALGQGGEVFVLDMGRPVRIKDLAETMIRHAGLRPGLDIPIVFTGRRPGEKLFEELLTAEEGTTATVNQRIYRARISRTHDYAGMLDNLRRLEEAVRSGDAGQIRAEITRQVGSYRPDETCLNGHPTASGRSEYPPMAQAVPRRARETVEVRK
ncbi:polysaccharide biosynthesis protein [candidate division WOR-3 bacterium]|uniref:Polysaccharide biosynthesis protein n=1 Tax=candidate division WOR-3 bacterium TaxID=2052148 RepID=A0A938BUK3_UNCW3|nr:polysaccharide biosynthesis protein [candidate division WOR-3 bacterium]